MPKAAIVVDLYGQCADWQPILAACAEHGVPVIEDAVEALGATWGGRPAGSFGLLSTFSSKAPRQARAALSSISSTASPP